MKKILFVLFYCFSLSSLVSAQPEPGNNPQGPAISRRPVDTVAANIDSLKRPANLFGTDSLKKTAADSTDIPTFQELIRSNPFFQFSATPVSLLILPREIDGNELFFYALLLLFFYYALIRVVFYKYMGDLFTLFFRATLRQQQLREQLLQSPLPSLLMNVLFVMTGSLYAALLTKYNGLLPNTDFWLLAIYCMILLVSIYLVKFVVLKTLGWILKISRATDIYLFVVFMVNKVAGIFLLPVLLFLAFPVPAFSPVIIALSLFVLCLLLGYRFLISYRLIRSEIKVSLFHFFIYLCAFEIAPLLLLYKLLLSFERTF